MRIVIYDTETIGIVTQDLLNVGYKIIDLNLTDGTYKTLCEKDYLVSDLYRNEKWAINDKFVGLQKYAIYKYLVDGKLIKKHTIQKIFDLMSKDLTKYAVELGFAYNSNFDIDKFRKTADKLQIANPLDLLRNTHDIWTYSRQYICDQADYIEWAQENGIITESGKYYSTSVESVVKFLTKDLDFAEQHTALSDTQWETKILIECFNRGCDITRVGKYKKFIPVVSE